MLSQQFRHRTVADLRGRVLEVGAGSGPNFPHYHKARAVVAVEPDPTMRRHATRRAALVARPIQIVDARAEELPFVTHSFDAAVLTLVLCSVEDVEQSLAEMRRVLRRGATLRVVEHVRAKEKWMAAFQTRLTTLSHCLGGRCRLDRDSFGALCAGGFTIEHCRSHVGGLLIEVTARTR